MIDGILEIEQLGRFPDVTRPEMRFVRLHGHRIVCWIGGGVPRPERPVLLLIHGVAGSSATWEAVLPALAQRYTIVAPDLLGHGQSDKPRHDYSLGAYANMVRDLMIAFGIDRATIVGHSFGGGVAMQFAYQHPSRCERLVLESSGGLGPEVSLIFRALTVPGAEYLMPLIFPSFVRLAGDLVAGGMQRLGVRAPNLAQSWRAYAELTKAENRPVFLNTLRSVIDRRGQTVSAHDRLYLAGWVPTLIVWGKRDRMIPVEHAIAAHEAMASSQLAIFERVGHFPHAERPDRFVDALTAFIEATAPMHLDEPQWRAALTAGPRPRRKRMATFPESRGNDAGIDVVPRTGRRRATESTEAGTFDPVNNACRSVELESEAVPVRKRASAAGRRPGSGDHAGTRDDSRNL